MGTTSLRDGFPNPRRCHGQVRLNIRPVYLSGNIADLHAFSGTGYSKLGTLVELSLPPTGELQADKLPQDSPATTRPRSCSPLQLRVRLVLEVLDPAVLLSQINRLSWAVEAGQVHTCLGSVERKTWISSLVTKHWPRLVVLDMASIIQSAMARLRTGILWSGIGRTRSSNISVSSLKTTTSY